MNYCFELIKLIAFMYLFGYNFSRLFDHLDMGKYWFALINTLLIFVFGYFSYLQIMIFVKLF